MRASRLVVVLAALAAPLALAIVTWSEEEGPAAPSPEQQAPSAPSFQLPSSRGPGGSPRTVPTPDAMPMRSDEKYAAQCGGKKRAIDRVRADYSRHRSIWEDHCQPESRPCGAEPNPHAPEFSEADVTAWESCVANWRRRQERHARLGRCTTREEAMRELAAEFRVEHQRLCERGCEDLQPLWRGGEPRRCESADDGTDYEMSPSTGRRRRR